MFGWKKQTTKPITPTNTGRINTILKDDLDSYFDLIHSLFLVLDVDGKVTRINQFGLDLLGYKREEIIGKVWWDVCVPERIRSEVSGVFNGAKRNSPEFDSHENVIVTRLGEERIIQWHNAVLRDDAGEMIGGFSTGEDVTELKKRQIEFLKTEQRLRLVMDLSKLVQWEYDVASDTFTLNDDFYKLYGTSANKEGGYEIASKVYAEKFVHPEDQKLVGEEIQKLLVTSDPHYTAEVTHRIVRGDGEIREMMVRFSVLKDEAGKTVKTYGASQDVTEWKRTNERLKQLASYPELNPNPVAEINLDGTVMYANPALKKIFPDLEIMSHIWLSDFPKVLAELKQPGKESVVREFPTGQSNYQLTFTLINSVGTVRIYGLDITERIRTELIIKENEKFLESVIENIPNMLFIKDAKELKFVKFNKAAEELLGYSREEMLGKNDYDFFPKDEADAFIKDDRMVLASNKAVEIMDQPIQTKNKGMRYLQSRKIPILDEAGQPQYLLGISEDITERKRAYVELKKFKQGIERSDDVVFMTDKDGLFTYTNFAFTELYGYSLNEIVTQTPRILKSGKQSDEFYAEFWKTLYSGSVVAATLFNKTKNGVLVTMKITASPIIDENKQISGFLAIQRDVTKDEEAQRLLSERALELEKLNKLMVGREIKMVELKNDIRRLTGEEAKFGGRE